MMTDTWTWATVTQATPLRIKVDGDTSALDATTDNLVGSLAVDDRVRVHLHADGIIVTGVQGGVVGTTEATAATANTLALRDGDGQLKAADGVADDDVATKGQLDARAVTTLFSGSADGGSNVSLSPPATDYSYLTIFYRDNDGFFNSVTVWMDDITIGTSPTSSSSVLLVTASGSTLAYLKRRVVYFYSSTSIRNEGTEYVAINSSNWTANNGQITIIRVVGHP